MKQYSNYNPSGYNPPPPGGGLPQNYDPGFPPPYAPPPPEDMGTGKIVGLSALACCIPLIGPLIALIIGIIERAKKGAVAVIVIGAVMLVLSVPLLGIYAAVLVPLMMYNAPESTQQEFEGLMGGTYIKVKDKAKEAEVKANLHNIQLNLERYYIDHNGAYPDTIQTLIQTGKYEEIPRNPFHEGQAMQAVELSDPPESRQGNFTYLTQSKEGKIVAYKLLGYGAIATTDSTYPAGAGPAAVVITLDNGEWTGE